MSYRYRRSDLVAEYIGGTPSKTAKFIKKAEEDVFFVDEEYTLCSLLQARFWEGVHRDSYEQHE